MSDTATSHPSLLGTIGQLVRGGVGYLADLVAQLVHGIGGAIGRGISSLALAPVALATGCSSEPVEASSARPSTELSAPIDAAVDADLSPRQLGLFNMTFYYVIREDEVRPRQVANENRDDRKGDVGSGTELAAVAPVHDLVTVYGPGKRCEPIAEVSREFAQQLRVQGTGRLRDGRVLNVWSRCKCPSSLCFKVIPQQWGTGGNGRPLHPFRTVAVDPRLIKLGSLLYVPMLDGRTMPGRAPWGGFVHDGCVIADDTGGGIKGQQLDLFVGRKAWYHGLSSHGRHSWARQVPVFDGTKLCERKGRRVARKAASI